MTMLGVHEYFSNKKFSNKNKNRNLVFMLYIYMVPGEKPPEH